MNTKAGRKPLEPGDDTVRYQIRLSASLRDRAKAQADRLDLDLAVVVRQALERWLKRHGG